MIIIAKTAMIKFFYCMQFLESEFLPYLDAWEDSVKNRQGEFGDGEHKRMLLSSETLLGIRITSEYYNFNH